MQVFILIAREANKYQSALPILYTNRNQRS
jgi:hypothetical protein